MKVALITGDRVSRGRDGGLTAGLASTRMRLILALRALWSTGHDAWLLANTPAERMRRSEAFRDAETVLFGKIFEDHVATAETAKRAGKRVIVDVSDDPEQLGEFRHIRAILGLADAATTPTPQLAEAIRRLLPAGAPIVLIPDPVDAPLRPPRAPGRTRRGIPPGGQPDRLRLCWFGSAGNAPHLAAQMPGLRDLARRVPMHLSVVSSGRNFFHDVLDPPPGKGSDLPTAFVDWSAAAQNRELDACDLVILPGDATGRSALKSANRLVTSIAAGRLAVASPLPAYEPLRANALLVDGLAEGVEAALAVSPDPIERRLLAGQTAIRKRFAPAILGRKWVNSLAALAGARDRADAHEAIEAAQPSD